jgi:toxin FitB
MKKDVVTDVGFDWYHTLSRIGIAGGAVYDGLVALAAKEHGATLATRDARARGGYDAVGVKVIIVS